MIVIADTNILISALITPKGSIAKIFKSKSKIQFIAPSYLLLEIYEHWGKIAENSSLTKYELIKELDFLKSKINFIQDKEIPKKFRIEAYNIVKEVDVDDVSFVALNRYKKHKIWTTDKVLASGLKKKGYDICITTSQIKNSLYKK